MESAVGDVVSPAVAEALREYRLARADSIHADNASTELSERARAALDASIEASGRLAQATMALLDAAMGGG